MRDIQLNEATPSLREIPIHAVLDSDGKTPATGVTLTVQIRKAGAVAWSAAGGTVNEVGNGSYTYNPLVGEIDTLGLFELRAKEATTAEYQIAVQIVGYNPHAVDLGIPDAANLANADLPVSSRSTFNPATDTVANVTTTADVTNTVGANVTFWQGVPVLALVGQRVEAHVGSILDSVITAAKFAANAISAAAFAQAAADKVWSTATRSITDKAGFSLSTVGNNAVRDAILSDSTAFPGANIDAAISSRGTSDFNAATDEVDVGSIKGEDAQRLADSMNASVPVTVSSATDATKFIISGANGNVAGRAIIFLDADAGNQNRGEARVILAHNTGTGEIDVGFADETVPGTGFTTTPQAGNTAIVV